MTVKFNQTDIEQIRVQRENLKRKIKCLCSKYEKKTIFIHLSTKKVLHRLCDTYKRWLTYAKKMTSQTRRQRPGGHEILGFRGCPAPDRYTPRSPLERRTGYAADCPEPADSRQEVIFIIQSFQYVIHLILHLLGCFLYLYWIEQKAKGKREGTSCRTNAKDSACYTWGTHSTRWATRAAHIQFPF